jgi:transposase-like protein
MPKHPGGRPTKYDPKFCKQMLTFFNVEPYRKEVAEKSKEYFANGELKKESEKYRFVPNELPQFAMFARKIGVHRDTLDAWRKAHQEFSDAYNESKELQKHFLITIGLAGAAPPASFIFVSKNITDMRDEQYLDHTSKGKAISTPTVIKVIQPPAKPENAE